MNINNLCYHCFSEKPVAEKPCPKCGYIYTPNSSPSRHLLPGTILCNRYIVGEELGAGGFGVTYKCLDMSLGGVCAIKEFFPAAIALRTAPSPAVMVDSDNLPRYNRFKQRFVSEADLLRRLNHPNIISTYDSFYANNTAYYVMEYCNGVNLRCYSNNFSRRVSYEEGINLLCQVMNGLEYIHSQGIFHRDIAPDNIYVTNNNNVKILDFGSARSEMEQQNRELSVILKVGYAPLEQYGGRGKQGPYTDIYGLAATFYHLMTQKVPLESTERVVDDGLVPFSSLRPDLPHNLQYCVEQCMALSASARPASIAQMRSILWPTKADSASQRVQAQKINWSPTTHKQNNRPNVKVKVKSVTPVKAKQSVAEIAKTAQAVVQKPASVAESPKPKKVITSGQRQYGRLSASIYARASAYVIDLLVWGVIYFTILYLSIGEFDSVFIGFATMFPVVFTVANIALEFISSQTVGKALLGLRVCGRVYYEVEPGEIIIRNIIKLLGIFVYVFGDEGKLLEDKTDSMVCIVERE